MNEIKLDTRELDRIAKKLDISTEAVVRRFAFQVEAEAKAAAPVDTGALRNSIYTTTQHGQGTQPGDRGDADTYELPKPEGKVLAIVGPSVSYALAVELPGVTRKWAGKPYLTPAVEHVSRRYNDGTEWKEIVK